MPIATRALARAQAAGVTRQIVPAIALVRLKICAPCARRNKVFIPLTVCIRCFCSGIDAEHLDELAQWIEREKPVAVGECGLDFYVPGLDAGNAAHIFPTPA